MSSTPPAGPGTPVPGPPPLDSPVLRRLARDRRLMMVMPGSMVMQVAHPAVGAGVGAHSVFRTDPWGRLRHSLASTMRLVDGGAGALAEGTRLREVHREIRGVDARGRRYSALDPEAYAWVHLILFERLVTMSRLFGPPLPDADRVALYAEMIELGAALGIRRRHLPVDEAAFWPYLDRMTREVLENHPTVHEFLGVLRTSPVAAPRWPLPGWTWPAAGRPFGAVGHFLAVGTLSPELRDRLELRWSPTQERTLAAMARGVTRGVTRLPARWWQAPPAIT